MRWWQEGLGLLAVLWACQAAGTWLQMRHYRGVMQTIAHSWPDGFVGASAARGYLGKGVIAIIVASPDAIVRQVFLMEGRSVFASFREVPEAQGCTLAAVTTDGFAVASKGRQKALTGAIGQIRTALDRRATSGAGAVPAALAA